MLDLVGLRPPPDGQETPHLPLDPEPRSAGRARAFVRDVVGPVSQQAAEDLALLTSEVVTNGVLHAQSPLVLGVVRVGDLILVSVGDESSEAPRPQPFSQTRDSGRGITLVAGLAEQWGTLTHEGGKSVWFLVRDGGSTL